MQRVADSVGFLYSGRLLVHRNIDELLAGTRRVRATLTGGSPPETLPAGVIWQQVEGRNWSVTISDFTPDVVQEIGSLDGVDHVEVIEVGLEDLFKDFVKGQRSTT